MRNFPALFARRGRRMAQKREPGAPPLGSAKRRKPTVGEFVGEDEAAARAPSTSG